MLNLFGVILFLHIVAGLEKAYGCEPIQETPKKESIAWNKCLEYQEKYVFPCGGSKREDRCGHGGDDLTLGGTDAKRGQFPHMVLLGYKDEVRNEVKWLCGGSIISEQYIVTAGYCGSTREYGPVSLARLATHEKTDAIDDKYLYKIASIIKHPMYTPPKRYNDITLLKTEKPMALDHLTVPICLHTGEDDDEQRALAVGWGRTTKLGGFQNTLQKVPQNKVSEEVCAKEYPPSRHLDRGINFTTQVCYGVGKGEKDACQGFGGGPLLIENKKIKCMYTLLGVISFGIGCSDGAPGVYTRVAAYVPWIESVVWN